MGKWQVRVPKKWRSMGHAKANAKLHDQKHGEETFYDDGEEDSQMLVSFLLGSCVCLLQRRATEASTVEFTSMHHVVQIHSRVKRF